MATRRGFSVDGSVRIAAADRAGRERLLRYCARPPLALDRLRELDPVRLLYESNKQGPGGNGPQILTPLELLDRLAALVRGACGSAAEGSAPCAGRSAFSKSSECGRMLRRPPPDFRAIAMLTILDQFRRYMKRARPPAAIAPGDDYLRGYLQGLRHHQRVKQFGAQDKHAQWLGMADSPESVEFERGYRDGFAGLERRL